MDRFSGSLLAIAATINSMPDSKTKAFDGIGGRRIVVQVLLGAAKRLIALENAEAEDGPSTDQR